MVKTVYHTLHYHKPLKQFMILHFIILDFFILHFFYGVDKILSEAQHRELLVINVCK